MSKEIQFFKTVTKSLTAKDSDRRLFEGLLTVEMVDKQNEITIVDELIKALPIWIARGGAISDTHSNRIVGKGINYEKTTVDDGEGNVYPAILIQGEIYKDYELDDEIWEKIKDGTYKGLSFGGATRSDRKPIRNKDGTISYALSDLEHYEVAVCEDPAVPLALILDYNSIAKANIKKEQYTSRGNVACIRCTKVGCFIEKWNDTKYTDRDASRVEEQSEGEENSSVQGRNKPYVQENPPAFKAGKTKKPEKITAGNQNDPLGQDPTIHSTGLGERVTGAGVGGMENTYKFHEDDEEDKEKTVNSGENLVMEKPIRGIRGTGGERGFDPIEGKSDTNKYGDGAYCMTGIVDDGDKEVPRDEKDKAEGGTIGTTIQAVNGENGKQGNILTYNDKPAEGLDDKKKGPIIGGGIKGNVDTFEQDTGDSRQVTHRKVQSRETRHGRDTIQVSSDVDDGYSLGKSVEIEAELLKLKAKLVTLNVD